MKKRKLSALVVSALLLAALTLLSSAASVFPDVNGNEYYAEAAETLYKAGIISGYEDGSFGASLPITRAETATMLCRATVLAEYASLGNEYTLFSDMGPWHWANGFVNILSTFEIINGYEDGTFRPENHILYEETIKLVVSMEVGALEADGDDWAAPYIGYAEAAGYTENLIGHTGEAITRGDVAVLLYAVMTKNAEQDTPTVGRDETLPSPTPRDEDDQAVASQNEALCVGEHSYTVGMSEGALLDVAGQPDERLTSTTAGLTWYVFGTDTYENFFLAGIQNGTVVALCSNAKNASCNGARIGATRYSFANTETAHITDYTDSNDNGILHTILVTTPSLSLYPDKNPSAEQLAGESKVNFHMVNGFRVYHGLSVLSWNEASATAARLHSEDMAAQNYFSHESADGRTLSDRLKAQGISYRTAGENILAGQRNGIMAHNSWVNSGGHRNNILRTGVTSLGVGGGYGDHCYYTQDFVG